VNHCGEQAPIIRFGARGAEQPVAFAAADSAGGIALRLAGRD